MGIQELDNLTKYLLGFKEPRSNFVARIVNSENKAMTCLEVLSLIDKKVFRNASRKNVSACLSEAVKKKLLRKIPIQEYNSQSRFRYAPYVGVVNPNYYSKPIPQNFTKNEDKVLDIVKKQVGNAIDKCPKGINVKVNISNESVEVTYFVKRSDE